MKRLLPILLTLFCFFIATSAFGENEFLPEGEYTLSSYSLSNGEPVTFSENSPKSSLNFHSLYIFPEAMDSALNRDESFLDIPRMSFSEDSYEGFVIRAAYSPTSDITFYSSIGLTDTLEDSSFDYADRIGWEIDLGLAYKVFNNFSYEIHFGYMDTGELFKKSSSFADVESITILANKLTMSF
ncbi:MAG: hypothetical protein ABFR63_01790 [Thermodesulfobacteriota bacterium]